MGKRSDSKCQDREAPQHPNGKQLQVNTANQQQLGSQDSQSANDEEPLAVQVSSEAKECRKLQKALREISQLECQQRDGQKLHLNQLQKIDKKDAYAARLEELK